MVFKILVCFLLILTFYSANAQHLKIVNGSKVKKGELPYMVSIRYGGRHHCGGSILNKNHILTAAHCLYWFETKYLSVIAGQVFIDTQQYLEGIKVEDRVIHNQFKTSLGYDNDIAIIRLRENLKYGPTIQPVGLPAVNWKTPEGLDVIVSGWGHEKTNGQIQDHLQKVTLSAMSFEECLSYYSLYLSFFAHQCAGNRPGQSHCSADSGGLLVHAEQLFQIGIVSWSGKPCGDYPGVYTNVVNYLDWIDANKNF